MEFQRTAMVLVLLTVGLAGCFGGGGQNGTNAYECRLRVVDLFITQDDSASWPLYTLNNGETQSVVAMGFQLGGDNVAANPSQGESGLVVPNPMLEFNECDTVEITVHNNNPLSHTFHLHGGLVPWTEDGVPFLSQLPIHENGERTYRFENMKAGTYWYHCHVDVAHHIDLGMYGAFIVHEREPVYAADTDVTLMLDEWDNCHIHGDPNPLNNRETGAYPAGDADCQGRQFQDYYGQGGATNTATNNPQAQALCDDPDTPQEIKDALGCAHGEAPPYREPRSWYYADFPPYTPLYNTYTINGKSFPDTLPVYFEEGDTVRIRLINVGEEWHSMHLHGHSFLAAYKDGYPVTNPMRMDTISVGPGERWDIIVEADNPGFWAFHDHVGLSVANDYQAPGGMFTIVAYEGAFAQGIGFDPSMIDTALDVMDWTKTYHEEHGDEHDHNGEVNPPRGKNVMVRDPATGMVSYRPV